MRLTVADLKRLIIEVAANDDDIIRVGSDSAERFDYLTAVGADNDTGTFILYFDKE